MVYLSVFQFCIFANFLPPPPPADSGVNTTELYEELKAEFPDHIPIYLSRLQALENEKDRNLKGIVETADLALKNLNMSELLEFYGMKSDTRKDATKIKRYNRDSVFLVFQNFISFLFFWLAAWTRTNHTCWKLYQKKVLHYVTCITVQIT